LANGVGVYVQPAAGDGTISNYYGVEVANPSAPTTKAYGLYSGIVDAADHYNFYASGTAPNYFAGSVGIGTTTMTHKLNVSGNVAATAYYGDGSNLTGIVTGSIDEGGF